MKVKLLTTLTLALLAGPMVANAGLVGSYGTGSTGSVTGGTLTADQPVFDVTHPAYFQGVTTPASNWIWTNDPTETATINITFSFDLTGYDLGTVSLSGEWGVDNTGSVALNGNTLSSLPTTAQSNFNTLTPFSTSDLSLFNQGVNTLVYTASNAGGPGAFRATGELYADLIVVPPVAVPAPASLMLVGLGLVLLRLRKR